MNDFRINMSRAEWRRLIRVWCGQIQAGLWYYECPFCSRMLNGLTEKDERRFAEHVATCDAEHHKAAEVRKKTVPLWHPKKRKKR